MWEIIPVTGETQMWGLDLCQEESLQDLVEIIVCLEEDFRVRHQRGRKVNCFKKLESLEKDNEQLIKDMGKLKEILKGKVINRHFVEEDVIVDVNLMNAGAPKMMLIDSGDPKSVVSRE